MIHTLLKRISGILCILAITSPCAVAQYDVIDISRPFIRKIPLAISQMTAITHTGGEPAVALSASDELTRMLDFTGYFKMVDRDVFLEDLSQKGITINAVNFRNWTIIGAEYLVTGGVMLTGGELILELRLFDTFKEKLVVGKRYRGAEGDLRRILIRFCDEMIHALTGSFGVFNSKIAFVSTTSGNKEIYICDFDGRLPYAFTRNKSINLFPAWSNDGKTLAYTSYKYGNPDLLIQDLGRETIKRISNPGINTTPAWVPGKPNLLAATFSFEQDTEIYLLTREGKIIKNLTRKWGIDSSPAWSPDGGRMAFVSDRTGTPQIYIMDVDSGHTERLTFHGRYNTQPAWSPKGDRIAYTGLEQGVNNIFVIGVKGSKLYQLTDQTGNNESPTWSPDGSMIAFSSTREGVSRIYVMNAFGTDQRRLLAMGGEQTNPRWSSRISDDD